MRAALTRSAVFFICFCASIGPALAQTSSEVPAFLIESRTVDGSVTYRFDVELPQPPPGAATPSPAPSPSASPAGPQTIRFATFDLDHVRLTLLDAAGHDTTETIVAEHDPDGEVHPKLRFGSHWALPVALYNRLVILADAASAPTYPGKPVTAQLQPIAASENVDGTITTHPGKEAHLAYAGTGSVTPSRDLIGGAAPPERAERGGPGGGRFGGGPGGGRGRRGGEGQEPRKATATVHVDAAFRDSSLQHAEATETLAFDNPGGASKLTWSVVRVP